MLLLSGEVNFSLSLGNCRVVGQVRNTLVSQLEAEVARNPNVFESEVDGTTLGVGCLQPIFRGLF